MLPRLSVSQFVTVVNQSFAVSFGMVEVTGEVAGFAVRHGKWVFFDLKDTTSTVSCFMSVYQLRQPIEDGMQVVVQAEPTVTNWGKFSLTVKQYQLRGQGSLRRSFELLRTRLAAEGLFATERKRPLPPMPQRLGVISSVQAAGYADFLTVVNQRWGGLTIDVAQVQVQGSAAPDQIIRALAFFNEHAPLPDVVVILRGGGSADDLAAFQDELVVRAIAASRAPTVVGVGHDTDETLADLAADVRAATPSHAAQLVVPDRRDVQARLDQQLQAAAHRTRHALHDTMAVVEQRQQQAAVVWRQRLDQATDRLQSQRQLLAEYDPAVVLRRGYAILQGRLRIGSVIDITTDRAQMKARIEQYAKR